MDNFNSIPSSPYYSYYGTTHVFHFGQAGACNYHDILHMAHPVNPTAYSWQSHINPSQQNVNYCSTPNVHSTTGIPPGIYSPIEIPHGSYGHQNHEQNSPIIAGAHYINSQSSPTSSGYAIVSSDRCLSQTLGSSDTSVFDIPELSDCSMLESESSSSASNISPSAHPVTSNAVFFNYPSSATNVPNSRPGNHSFISVTSSTDVHTSVFSTSSGSTSYSSALSENYTVS